MIVLCLKATNVITLAFILKQVQELFMSFLISPSYLGSVGPDQNKN